MQQTLRDFAIAYAVGLVALLIIAYLLAVYTDFDLGGGVSIAVALGAAMHAGQRYAAREKAMPESGFSWAFAAKSFLAAFAVSFLLFMIISLFEPSLMQIAMGLPTLALLFGLVLAGIIHILAVRFFFPFSVKNGLKIQANKQ